MRCLWALLLIAAGIAAQEKAAPPPEVDAALRDRIQKFFQAHVDGKFRAADQYVAEESKDIFFSAEKPRYLSFEIVSITYSENFTRATATVNGEREIMMPMGGAFKMKFPRATLWKLIDGQWFWYIPQVETAQTPFGLVRPGAASGAAAPPAVDVSKGPTVADVLNMVTVDRSDITLSARQPSAEAVFTNRMPGHVTLAITSPSLPGLETKLDRAELGPYEAARLMVRTTAAKAGPRPSFTVDVRVEPVGQTIPIRVSFAPPAEAAQPAKAK
jgi:hypothetical protein